MEFKRSKFSRRIRKKRRLGEFTQTGFLIYLYVDSDIGEDKEKGNYIVDSFLNIIISKGMTCGGGGGIDKVSFFVDRYRKRITESEKNDVVSESLKIEGVTRVIAFELTDVWNSSAENYFNKVDELTKEWETKK